MFRFLYISMLVIHGLIHLLGFVKQWKIVEVSQLTGNGIIPLSEGASKVLGIFWLLACLAFLGAAAGYLMRKDWWWAIAAGGVVISQLLIILYWPDAKAGTVANVIILAGIVLGYGGSNFNWMAEREIKALQENADSKKEVVSEAMLVDLPFPVQRWLKRSGVVGKEKVRTLHLVQSGRMRTKPDGSWMPVEAEQYFSIDPPGFVWVADVKAAPLVNLAGRDKYAEGHGHMLIKLLNLVPVADATGPETDQGTLLRFLAEIVWFPTAALENYITWELIDSSAARATMSYGGTTASGVFTFNEDGDFIAFEAPRYYEQEGQFTLQTWSIASDRHEELGGFWIPVASRVTWKLESGNFTWFELEIKAVD